MYFKRESFRTYSHCWKLSVPVENATRSDSHLINLVAKHLLRIDARRDEMDVHKMEFNKKLRTFWELESTGIKQEENPVLGTFKETITVRNQRYEVGLPRKEAHDLLPENRSFSQRRLQSLKRLGQKPEKLEEYDRAIKDQLDKGIIERFHQCEKVQPCYQIHYLPHNCVVSEDKSTTKLHIVYNALVRENGPDCLHTWHPPTPDIPEILIRFRVQPIALVVDIKKAFLMTTVKEEDREVLRFLWVDDVNSAEPKIVEYRFSQVVFGVTSSPFLLNATLLRHITSYERENPKFVNQLLRFVCRWSEFKPWGCGQGIPTLKSGDRMARGGLNLRKWLTNSRPLMEKI